MAAGNPNLPKSPFKSLAIFSLFGLTRFAIKFIQNYREAKNPFTSNLDLPLPWVAEQQVPYRGAISFFDGNVFKRKRQSNDMVDRVDVCGG